MILARAAMILGVSASIAAAPVDPVVRTASGQVRGTGADGVESWKGIPFAAPPVGPLRWRAPQPVAAWPGVRAARGYGHDCMQLPFPSDAAPLGTPPAEDCLYLNVWRPAGVAAKRPVLLWIYGGGFVNGGSSPPTYAGDRMARRGLVFVSFNYRLGRFGTFAHPQLTRADADRGQLGNYGYMDQIAALRWVRRNIAAFGGDPANVTVMGESAGGASVHTLLTSPAARGLFARAIVMSGGDGTTLTGDGGGLGAAEAAGVNFAAAQGIAASDPRALARLRALPAERIVAGLNLAAMAPADPPTHVGPFVDGRIAVSPRDAYRTGTFTRVPVMVGATSADIGGPDGRMVAGARRVAQDLARAGVPVYAYRFSYVAAAVGEPGARHATDIPFFLDNADRKYGAQATPRDTGMARTIADYVANFARTGDPNGNGLPRWNREGAAAGAVMDFAPDGRPGMTDASAPSRTADGAPGG